MVYFSESFDKFSPPLHNSAQKAPDTLAELISHTDRALFQALDDGDVEKVETHLVEFCYTCSKMLEEEVALHALELYYYSIPIHLVRRMIQTGLHRMEDLANLSSLVNAIKQWTTIQEYISLTPWYAAQLMAFTQDNSSLIHANPYVLEALSILQKKLDDPHLSTASIAKEIGISQGYLASLFKEETGQSISSYMKKYRLKKAAVDLVTTHLPLKQIALKHGFKSQSAFSKFFSEVYGITPLQFRARKSMLPDYPE